MDFLYRLAHLVATRYLGYLIPQAIFFIRTDCLLIIADTFDSAS